MIPGFGIHPWWSHLHASSQGDTWQQLLEAPVQEQVQQAIDILEHVDPVTNSGAHSVLVVVVVAGTLGGHVVQGGGGGTWQYLLEVPSKDQLQLG